MGHESHSTVFHWGMIYPAQEGSWTEKRGQFWMGNFASPHLESGQIQSPTFPAQHFKCNPFAFKRTVYLLTHDWHNTKPDAIHGDLLAKRSFHKVAISRRLFFPAVLHSKPVPVPSAWALQRRHLENIWEQLFTVETKVTLCGLSQHFFFPRPPWEEANCPQLQNKQANNNKKPSIKKQMMEKPWAYFPGADIVLCF